MVNNGIGPIIGAMSFIIIGLAIATIPLDIFELVKPYLFTTYFDIWNKVFLEPIPWTEIRHDSMVLFIYMISFISVSFIVFNRKDILT